MPRQPPTATVTLAINAASITTSPGTHGRIVVMAAGVPEAELLDAVVTQVDVGTLIDAAGEEVIAEELDRRRRS